MPKFNKAREAQFTAEQVRKKLRYVAETGELFYLIYYGSPVGNKSVRADYQSKSGYRRIKLGSIGFPAHRVAWLLQTGRWPEDQIDHRDCDRANNKWANLRVATHSQNQANGKHYKNNRLGFKGVSRIPTRPGKFRARLRKDGREYSLGVYDTAAEAHVAYIEAAVELHGEFARTK